MKNNINLEQLLELIISSKIMGTPSYSVQKLTTSEYRIYRDIIYYLELEKHNHYIIDHLIVDFNPNTIWVYYKDGFNDNIIITSEQLYAAIIKYIKDNTRLLVLEKFGKELNRRLQMIKAQMEEQYLQEIIDKNPAIKQLLC